jgi:hypothetical protein
MRVIPEHIQKKILSVEYVYHGLITICFIKMENGFVATGQSACTHTSLFNKEKGEQNAHRDCLSKIFLLEGYLLKQKLFEQTGEAS